MRKTAAAVQPARRPDPRLARQGRRMVEGGVGRQGERARVLLARVVEESRVDRRHFFFIVIDADTATRRSSPARRTWATTRCTGRGEYVRFRTMYGVLPTRRAVPHWTRT